MMKNPSPTDQAARVQRSKVLNFPQAPGKESKSGNPEIRSVVPQEPNSVMRFLRLLGPGFITGASDDDPSGICTYAQVGASLGFSFLWTALFTFPLMTSVQFICAKVGMVSGMGLAGVLRKHYPRALLYAVGLGLVVANTINAGTDIGAIAAAINLFVPVPVVVMILPVTLAILFLQIWGSYRVIAKVFKWLTLALFAYIGSSFYAKPEMIEVLKGTFIPSVRLDSTLLTALVAILGTTISPYLFFWQATQEVEEERSMGRNTLSERKGATDVELRHAGWDTLIGMFFSNAVMYFIILATAATLFKAGKTDIATAAEAAQALRPLAGDAAYFLLAFGMIGTGFLAVPILTSSSAYAVSEAFGWRSGLDQKPKRAREFYTMIVLSTLVGMFINFIGINPIKALFWTAVLNGCLAPPLLVVIMLISNNRRVMGSRVNGIWTNLMGWTTATIMLVAAVALIFTRGH